MKDPDGRLFWYGLMTGLSIGLVLANLAFSCIGR